jgi:hypothetical protein
MENRTGCPSPHAKAGESAGEDVELEEPSFMV